MPDVVVAYFTLNRQSIDGVTAILRSIRAFRSASVDGSTIDIFPIATRIENAEQGLLEVARGYARAALAEFLPQAMQSSPREYWDKMEISYRPVYAFEEVLAAFRDATGAAGAGDTMLSQVEATAQRITGDRELRMPEIVEADRARVLAKYAFGALPTAGAKKTHTADDVADTDFLRGVRAKEQLWRTSKFAWRRLLSRRELDLLTSEDRAGFGRNMAFYLVQSERMQHLLRTAEIGGLVSFAFGVAFLLYVLWISLYSPSPVPFELRLREFYSMTAPYVLSASIGIWTFFLLVWSFVVGRARSYGVRLSQVFILTLRGPFRPDIRDYDPAEEPSR
jgi:hypothetical protein